MPAYMQVILSITSVFVAVCAVIVSVAQWTTARAQWNLAKQKFQFELFDKRLRAKNAIFNLGASVLIPDSKVKAWGEFVDHAFNCRFLFPDGAVLWIKEVFNQGWQYLLLDMQMKPLEKLGRPLDEKEKEQLLNLLKKQEGPHRFLLALGNEVDERLNPHLKLETV